MPDYVVSIVGDSGTPVLLLAGGAASSHDFFPCLADALGGHRLISLDRPGTGLAQTTGTATLASGSAAAAQVLDELDAGPAVVVGQSLGGALAVQFATDRPELVAGMVLIDPTPLDVPAELRAVRAIFAVLGLPGRLPKIGPRLDRALFRSMGRHLTVTPQTEKAFDVLTSSASLSTTSRAVRTLVKEADQLSKRVRRLNVPVALVTAERKPGHRIRASHERLATTLGGRVLAPPGAIHAEHLRDPAGVTQLVCAVVAEANDRN